MTLHPSYIGSATKKEGRENPALKGFSYWDAITTA